MIKVTTYLASILLVIGLSVNVANAAQQIETRYFSILYDESGEFTAGEISKFCDDVYENLMSQFDAFDDNPRVVCIVNDAVDLANGYAIYFQNTITIYATSMDYELRGQSNWLRNVFVHEMTHMVALKKASKGPINYLNISGGKYNENPDLSVNAYLYHLSQPNWFSEGVAQLGAETYGSDRWDTHRDMLIRAAWKEDALLSFDEMAVLSGRTGMESEMVYNQGYALLRYMRDTYGYDTIVDINNTGALFDFKPLIKEKLGISSKILYENWRASLDERYKAFRDREFSEGLEIVDEGSTDYFPAVSPDGRYLAWLSNRDGDYAILDLMLTDLDTGETYKLVERVEYRPSWSHDSRTIVYTKRPDKFPNFLDIFTYDITTDRERRISRQIRAKDPCFSPGDSLIVFVRNEAGNNSLAMITSRGTNLRYLSATHDGTQFYRPSFSPDGKRIVFGVFKQDYDRDIAVIDSDSPTWKYNWDIEDSTSAFSDSTSFAEESNFEILLSTPADERDPAFLLDGSGIVYASDRTGVFNLYRLDFATGRTTRITDVYGGAFCPSSAPNGDVYYAQFKARDFSIYRVNVADLIESLSPDNEEREYLIQPERFDPTDHFPATTITRKRILNAVVPRVNVGPSFIGSQFGLDVIDVGADVYVSDLLGHDSISFGGSVGKNFEKDVPLNSDFEVYYQRRLVPVTSSNYTHSPILYGSGIRSVVNYLNPLLDGDADSVYYADLPDLGYADVLHDVSRHVTVDDLFRYEFRRYNSGVYVPLARRHALRLEAGYRQYYLTATRDQRIADNSTFIWDGNDITDEVPEAGAVRTDDIRILTDMEYFNSKELSLTYTYSRNIPAADSDLMPQGTTALFRFTHMRTTVTDSLVGQPEYYVPVGIYQDLSMALGTYNPDPLLDELRPFDKHYDVNEYLGLFKHNHKLPIVDHVLSGLFFVGYRDLQLKDIQKGEGSGYNWPLKFYLGGANMMSGYPYFSFWGSKFAYTRFDYMFPIARRIGKTFGGFHVQRLYATAFFEAGNTWNFKKLTWGNLEEGTMKKDVGVELNLKTIWFYRFNAYLTVRVAWPLDQLDKNSSYRDLRDPQRYYFGLTM